MPLLRLNKTIFFFAHIPKAAGTTIYKYVREQGGSTALLADRVFDKVPVAMQHLRRDQYKLLAPRGFYDHGFCILRDPVDRMVSEFHYRALDDARLPWYAPTGSRAFRIKGRQRYFTFDQFVAFVLARFRQNPDVFGNHIRHQLDFAHPDHQMFLYEAGLDPVFDWIEQTADIPSGPRGIHLNTGATSRPEMSPQTLAQIRDFYAPDQELIDVLRNDGLIAAQGWLRDRI